MKYLSCLVTLSLAAGLMMIGVGLAKIAYLPSERDIGRALEGTELLIHKAKMKKHGIRNTEMVYVHHDGSEWYFNEKRQYCRFK